VYEYNRDNLLTEDEQILYDEIIEHALKMDDSFTTSLKKLPDNSRIWYVLDTIRNDHPEIFWISGYSESGIITKSIGITKRYSVEEIVNYKNKLERIYEPVIQKANNLTNDFAKVEYVKQALNDTQIYTIEDPSDYELIKKIMKSSEIEFKYIMDKIGIKSYCTSVDVSKHETEYTNKVYINNTWYDIKDNLSELIQNE
jgi:hypothetical protein